MHLSKQGCALPPGIKANPALDNPATYDFTLNKTSAAGVGGFPGLAAATSSGGLHTLLPAAVRILFVRPGLHLSLPSVRWCPLV